MNDADRVYAVRKRLEGGGKETIFLFWKKSHADAYVAAVSSPKVHVWCEEVWVHQKPYGGV